MTPRNGEVVIAATQDFITAAHLMTRKNLFLTRGELARLNLPLRLPLRLPLTLPIPKPLPLTRRVREAVLLHG